MHDLHLAIGEVLATLQFPNARVLLDGACGGQGPLLQFIGRCDDDVEVCLAQGDAAIVLNNEIKVALEIEETDLRPIVLCGKVMGTAISQQCEWNYTRFPLSSKMLFVQIFKQKSQNQKWSRYAKCRYIESEIKKLRSETFRIAEYSFHYGTAEKYRSDASEGNVLLDEIKTFFVGPNSQSQ